MTLIATVLGAISGMGGGILMKPIMDGFGDFNAEVIGLLTSVTVLVMAVISTARQSRNKADIKIEIIPFVLLAVSSALGGVGGQILFGTLTGRASNESVKAVQNVVLFIVVLFIIVYMLAKDKKVVTQTVSIDGAEMLELPQKTVEIVPRIKPLMLKHPIAYVITGMCLGIVASFLGIGGGPMNVAVLIFLFGMNMKTAVLASLITIMASQSARLITMSITGFPSINTQIAWVLVIMVITGAIGGLLGSFLQKKFSQKAVEICFNCVQVVVLALCVYNIIYFGIIA